MRKERPELNEFAGDLISDALHVQIMP